MTEKNETEKMRTSQSEKTASNPQAEGARTSPTVLAEREPQTEEKERDSQASRGEPEMRGPQPALAERQRSLETEETEAPQIEGAEPFKQKLLQK